MDRTKSEALWTREFLGMSLSNFLIYITQYAMIAALPIVIMTEYGGGDVEAGLAMTFFQIGTVTARPFAGILIDAVNKRHLMIAITVAFFLVMTAFAFAAALSALYGLRLLHGVIFAVATTTAAALVALVLPPARKGEGIGYFALSTNLAMVVGPMIGLLLMEHSSATLCSAQHTCRHLHRCGRRAETSRRGHPAAKKGWTHTFRQYVHRAARPCPRTYRRHSLLRLRQRPHLHPALYAQPRALL